MESVELKLRELDNGKFVVGYTKKIVEILDEPELSLEVKAGQISEDVSRLIESLGYQVTARKAMVGWILLKAVGVTVPFFYLMTIIPIIMVAANLPVTTLGLGTREIAIVYFCSRFGQAASLLSGGIMVSLVEHVLPVMVGLMFIHSFHTYFTMKDEVYALKEDGK